MFPSDNNDLSNNLSSSAEEIQGLSFGLVQALNVFHWLGYGLLLLTLFDWIDTLTPLKFMNPLWEFQTIGALVEKVVVPLLGFVLIFSGANWARRAWERSLLKVLSWLALVLGILYLLMVPLGILNTVRLNETNQTQILNFTDKQLGPIKTLKGQLEGVGNETQLAEVLEEVKKGGIAIQPKPGESYETVKKDLLEFLTGAQRKIETQAKEARSTQQIGLIKNSVKWNLGALVAGVWLIGIWRLTGWARF
ncbi:MAG: HpsJ family protein [Merismopediaceae bacterium]|nr:HpsJ family protein [Merismopediaceae bacterium]